jgi:hypothetical protein
LRLLKILSYFVLPPIKNIFIDFLPEDAGQVKDVLYSLKSSNIESFFFNFYSFKTIDVTPYVRSFGKIASSANTKRLTIYN